MARFAVVVPLYNKAPYIRKALRSVFDQTFGDWELVVVDDGSTDGSAGTARECIMSFPDSSKCRLIPETNSGVGAARNNGVAASAGEYLCFLDADDWWDEHFLERMNSLIEEYPEAGIYGTSYYLVKNGRRRVAPIALDRGFTKGFINYCEVYSRFLCMPLCTGSVALKRCVFDEMNGFKTNLRLGEDFDLWIRVALNHRVAFLNEQLFYYNQDVELKNRATRRLHEPQHHILFNLDYLEPVEAVNPDYKRLVDKLRVYSLLDYRMVKRYRGRAESELAKVDWSQQPEEVARRYRIPICLMKCHQTFLKFGARVKNHWKRAL